MSGPVGGDSSSQPMEITNMMTGAYTNLETSPGFGSPNPMTAQQQQFQQQLLLMQQQHPSLYQQQPPISSSNPSGSPTTATTAADNSTAMTDVDYLDETPSEKSEREKVERLAADRMNRVAGRANAREAKAASVSAIQSATGVEISERELLRAQAARERELELNELMEEGDALEAVPHKKNNTAVKPSVVAAASKPASSVLLEDIEISEADAKFLDEDTKSRTKHNKLMRTMMKDGQVKQDRYIKKHMNEFRAFLNKKMRKKYDDKEEGDDEEGDATQDQQKANERAGVKAAQLSAANPEATRVDLPASNANDVLADAKDITLPQSKIFEKQPPYIVNGTMREYQILGLNWLINRHENAIGGILGDEMGLGKTLQIIAFLSYLKYERGIGGPHLIVVPLSVMSAWMTEFKRWSPGFRVVRYHGPLAERRRLQNDDASFGNFDVILTTYEMIVGDEDFFRYKFIWHYVIVDEAHRIKNEKTLQAQALASIQRFNCILLSGTPTQNNTHEIWALLHFLLPKVFTSSEPFDRCFNLTTNSIDQEQLFKIHTLLKPLMLRRVKAEIQQKLPKKTETKIFVGLSELQKEWYRKLVTKDINLLIGSSGNVTGTVEPATSHYAGGSEWRRLMSLMMQLRKVCNHPYLISGEAEPQWDSIRREEAKADAAAVKAGKKPEARETIETRAGKVLIQSSGKMIVLDKLLTKLKNEGGHRVLLFSLFTRVLDLLEDYFNFKGWAYLRLDGSTNRVRRSVDIRRFNDPNSRFFVYLISTRAGGLGINLTGADTVVHFDSDFNPQVDLQAQDRCHRIGQTKPVNVYRFITENSVEERLIARAEKKLYLDIMVNRLSHHADADNLGSEQEELTKLSKDEMLSMLMFGASRIFKATSNEPPRDEDIEAILTRSIAKDNETKSSKMKEIMSKREVIAAAVAGNANGKEDILLEDDGRQVIAQEREELKQVAGSELTEEKTDNAAASAASSSTAGSPTSNIIENAHLTVKDFLFDGKGERSVHDFEGHDFAQDVKSSKKNPFNTINPEAIVEEGKKRERKQRLLLVEDGRGKSFTILASQQHDAPIRDQRYKPKKRGRPKTKMELFEEEAFAATPTSTPIKGAAASAPSTPEPEVVKPLEPKVIGYDYEINWEKSSAHSSKDLEKAVKALNALDAKGTDVTEKEHKLSLWIKRSERWNMSKEEKLAYELRIREEQKQIIALRDAKRRRWAAGAPEEAWLNEEKLEKAAEKAKGGATKRKSKGPDGEYQYNDKYIHEDWCHLCKLGGDLLCCGYCPRTYHMECVGLSRPPGGYFSCPQHKCAKCERSSQEAGGMLFRCVVCPCSYCVASDTPINLPSGISVPIEEFESRSTLSYAPHSSQVVPHQVAKRFDNGFKECMELVFADGRALTCTPDHRILLSSGKWMTAEQLIVHESTVAASVQYPLVTRDEDVANAARWSLSTSSHLTFDLDMTTRRSEAMAFARLFGKFSASQTTLSTPTMQDFMILRDDIKLLTAIEPILRQSTTFDLDLPTELVQCFQSLSIPSTHLPSFILSPQCPLTIVREFLGGLFGSFSELSQGQIQIRGQVPMDELLPLLARFGINAEKDANGVSMELTPAFATHIGFRYSSEKQMRLTHAVSCIKSSLPINDSFRVMDQTGFSIYAVQLISKRDVGLKHVYDLSVPNQQDAAFNSYLASGIVVHNCEDDLPTEYEGRKDLDRCFELEMTGYSQPSSAFFITCSHSCTKYYQDYLDGKFSDSSEEVSAPIPIDLVNAEHAAAEAEAAKAKADADAALEADIAGAKRRGGRKAKTESAAAAAAASSSPKIPEAASFLPGPTPEAQAVAASFSEAPYIIQPPSEDTPHICSCLMPKKAKPKLYCICKTPYDKRRAYLACDGCGQWYHLTCVGMKENDDVEMVEWTCKGCQLKEKQKSSKSSGSFELDSDVSSDDDDDDSSAAPSDDEDSGSSASEPMSDDEPTGVTHEEDRIKREKQRKKAKQAAANAKATPSKARNVNTTSSATKSHAQPKKAKIRHPIDGGSQADAMAQPPVNLPTIADCLNMNFGVGPNGQPIAGGAAANGIPSNFMNLDPVALQQMMQFFGSSGGMVGQDGRVAQAALPAFPTTHHQQQVNMVQPSVQASAASAVLSAQQQSALDNMMQQAAYQQHQQQQQQLQQQSHTPMMAQTVAGMNPMSAVTVANDMQHRPMVMTQPATLPPSSLPPTTSYATMPVGAMAQQQQMLQPPATSPVGQQNSGISLASVMAAAQSVHHH